MILRHWFVAALLFTAACKHGYGQTDLEMAMSKHHIDLRWGRLENAALAVDDHFKSAFLAEWSQRQSTQELQDLEVQGIAMLDDGDNADVVVHITYIDRDTQQVKSATVVERWTRSTNGWRVTKPLSLDAALQAADSG